MPVDYLISQSLTPVSLAEHSLTDLFFCIVPSYVSRGRPPERRRKRNVDSESCVFLENF